MKERIIPNWLNLILIIVFLLSLILYFELAESPNFGSLFVNIAGTIFGILITVGFIDIVADHNNKKNWSQVNVRLKDWLLDILMRYYNYSFLNCGEMGAFIKIFNDKNLNKTEKSKLLSEGISNFLPSLINENIFCVFTDLAF